MDLENGVAKSHVLALPLPFQGHINPMLQFCKRLSSRGIKVTLVVASVDVSLQMESDLINVESIPNGSSEGVDNASQSFIENLKASILKHLPIILESRATAGDPVKVLVCDSVILPWAIDFVQRLGIPGAALFTQSAAVSTIYHHLYQGTFQIPLMEEPEITLPSLPPLEPKDLPSFMYDKGSYPYVFRAILAASVGFEKANWVLFNTYDGLENEVVSWMKKKYPAIKTIGPSIPSMYLDRRFKDDKDYGLSLFKPNTDDCIKWLGSKEIGSVVYASFGSLASLGERQMAETAQGLANSNCNFLWVVLTSEQNKLPNNFRSEIQEKGLIVSWCPQLEVLAHPAVGCFVTHCGWNSTLEALSLGVPMVAVPQWTDQPTNAQFVVDVWQVGVQAKANEKGIVTKEEIEFCIKQVMQGENAEKFKKNAIRLNELAKEAVSEGGSSDRNIEELVSSFSCL